MNVNIPRVSKVRERSELEVELIWAAFLKQLTFEGRGWRFVAGR